MAMATSKTWVSRRRTKLRINTDETEIAAAARDGIPCDSRTTLVRRAGGHPTSIVLYLTGGLPYGIGGRMARINGGESWEL